MQDTKFKEVLIVLVACTLLFLVLTIVILVVVFKYQKRRLLQQNEMMELEQQLNEQSLKAQLEIQEQTFHAISQEIHDNVGQLLSLARVQLNIVEETGQLDKNLIQSTKNCLGKAITDLRDLSKGLNSDWIQSATVDDALKQEVERINNIGIIETKMLVQGPVAEMGAQKKLILFRLVQECIQNCIKHAQATHLNILITYHPEGIEVSVQDNGIGFDPYNLSEGKQGLGLKNIQSRVRITGGHYDIKSYPDKGTSITLTIPYE